MEKKSRSSNFELLRIVAMFMVVAFHIVTHCIYPQLTDTASIARLGNGYFNHPVFYKKLLLLISVRPFGKTADTVFILLSGYFLIKRASIDLGKISKKLLSQVVFSTVILMICSFSFHRCFPDIYIGLISFLDVNAQSWFIGYYFIIVIVAALFLNRLLNNLNEAQYLSFLLTVFAVITFSWTGDLLESLADGLRTVFTGIFVYGFGGFIRKYDPFKKVRSYVFIFIWGVMYGFLYLSYYNITAVNIENYVLSHSAGEFIQSKLPLKDYNMIVIILGVCMFELFRRIHIPDSPLVNYIGSAAFMVYLIHDNAFFYYLWNTQDWIKVLYFHPGMFILKLLIWTTGSFITGVTAYSVFWGLGNICRRLRWIAVKD